MTKTKRAWAWFAAALMVATWAVPVGATDPASLTGGLALGSAVGCVACGGLGLAMLLSTNGVALLLWSRAAFAASTACIGVCVTALTT